MLNSAEHEILNAHKDKNIKKLGPFLVSGKTNVIFPAHNCWHFNINGQENFMLS